MVPVPVIRASMPVGMATVIVVAMHRQVLRIAVEWHLLPIVIAGTIMQTVFGRTIAGTAMA